MLASQRTASDAYSRLPVDAARDPISATGKEDAKHKLVDYKLLFLSISIQSPKEILVTVAVLTIIICSLCIMFCQAVFQAVSHF